MKNVILLKIEKVLSSMIFQFIRNADRICIFSHPLDFKGFLVICKRRCKIAYKVMGTSL